MASGGAPRAQLPGGGEILPGRGAALRGARSPAQPAAEVQRDCEQAARGAPGPSEPPVATLGWVALVVTAAPVRSPKGRGQHMVYITSPAAGKQLRGFRLSGPRGTRVVPACFAVPARNTGGRGGPPGKQGTDRGGFPADCK